MEPERQFDVVTVLNCSVRRLAMLKMNHLHFDQARFEGSGEPSACSDLQHPVAKPFDTRELDRLPQPTDDDPPYRPWWVVDRS
jgi:hypothetical protein